MKMDEQSKAGFREEKRKTKLEDVCPSKKGKLDLESVRAQIEEVADQKSGPEYWRSLEELAGSPDFQEALHREFPKGASEWVDSVSRRGFLKVMGASMALAGMTGCVKLPLEPIVPYVRQPEDVIPGRPMFYATAMTLGGYASPLLVESHLGRPTKIEGNDQHPASLGGTDIFAQASILGMYDPDRSQSVMSMGEQRSWQSFLNAIQRTAQRAKNVAGCGHSHSHADHLFADSGRPTARLPETLSTGQVARIRAGQPRQRTRRREDGVRAASRDPIQTRKRRCDRLARRRFPLRGIPRQRALHPRLRQTPQPRREHEPAVCHREHPEFDGSEGGSPATAAGIGDRVVCPWPGFCPGGWRGHDWNRKTRSPMLLPKICAHIKAPA